MPHSEIPEATADLRLPANDSSCLEPVIRNRDEHAPNG